MYYPNVIYHVFNHTNNMELLFRNEADYLKFLEKVKDLLLPFADVLCYCLMPTHFHFQIVVNSDGVLPAVGAVKQQKIHASLRILLSSYVRYFNAKYDRRGSLLRAKTKSKPAYLDFIPEDFELAEDDPFTRFIPYVRVCFRYIHNNPNEARLVDHPVEWPYSSAADYAGLRNDDICNYALAERLIGIKRLS